jgi:hypothetical protein
MNTICRHAKSAFEWTAIVLSVLIIIVGALLACLVSPVIFLLSARAERRDCRSQVIYDQTGASR